MPRRFFFVISFDQLSPLSLPCYGNRNVHCPSLDQLVLGASLFHNHYVQTVEKSENMRQWWTGNDFCAFTAPSAEAPQDALTTFLPPLIAQTVTTNYWELDTTIPLTSAQIAEQFLQWTTPAATEDMLCWIRLRNPLEQDERECVLFLEELLQELQQVLPSPAETSADSQAALHWIITAACGSVPEVDEEAAPPPFAAELSRSLSARLWTPLLVKGSTTGDNYSQHLTGLSTGVDLYQQLRHWLNPTAALQGVQPSPHEALLLCDETRLGWLTPHDLLVVDRSAWQAESRSEVPAEVAYYLKPEDRFDVSNLAITAPERIAELWQQMRNSPINGE